MARRIERHYVWQHCGDILLVHRLGDPCQRLLTGEKGVTAPEHGSYEAQLPEGRHMRGDIEPPRLQVLGAPDRLRPSSACDDRRTPRAKSGIAAGVGTAHECDGADGEFRCWCYHGHRRRHRRRY